MSTDIKPGQVWAWQDTYDAKGPHGSLIEIIEAGTDVTYQYRDAAGFDPEQTRAASAELIRANANLVRCHCRAGTEDTCDQHSTAPAPLDPSPEVIEAVNVLRDAGIRSAEDFDRLVAHQPAPEPQPEWKPGTVVKGTVVVDQTHDAVELDHDVQMMRVTHIDTVGRAYVSAGGDIIEPRHVTDVRPLVVLDPAAARKALEDNGWGEHETNEILHQLGIEAS